jgi:protein-L-isoaspartate(D-aspartate) O-methyltransferase
MDSLQLRQKMVDEQIVGRGITDPRVIKAMFQLERHRFVLTHAQPRAYEDNPVPIIHGQTVSQPYMVALMTERLRLTGAEKVLEIGTGSGYQTAILAGLAKEVYTVERFADMSRGASSLLAELNFTNIFYSVGDGSLGWKAAAPFERITVTAACPRIPFPLEEQLNEGGMIILPIGGPSIQTLSVGVKRKGTITLEPICDCRFVPLIGEFGMTKK